MERFKVSTEKSLFKPIEIEVDGKVYSIDMITAEILDKVEKYDKKAETADMTAVTELLELLLGIPKEVSRKIDVRDLNKMLTYVSGRIYNPMKYEREEEKKESRAAETPSKPS